jgi:hypothetical protein
VADATRTAVRSGVEDGRCRLGAPNNGHGSIRLVRDTSFSSENVRPTNFDLTDRSHFRRLTGPVVLVSHIECAGAPHVASSHGVRVHAASDSVASKGIPPGSRIHAGYSDFASRLQG